MTGIQSHSMEYFASIQDYNKLASEMQNKIRIWRQWCASKGLTSLWDKKLRNYYGVSASGNTSQMVTSGGSQGELALIKVNDLHSLLQGQLIIVTGQRPAGIARAINSDPKSIKASRIGSSIAEYYMTRPNFGYESKLITCAETALLCDEGYTELYWDKTAGKKIGIDPETQEDMMSGDVMLRTHSPWNCARDPGVKVADNRWHILTFHINKFDAAKTYPKFEQFILAAGKEDLPEMAMDSIPEGSDSIYAHLLIHDRSPAVPTGRYTLMIAQKIVLDQKLPFHDYPVDRMSPADVIDAPIGYCSANDIMALEQVTDALHSVITTNQTTFGGQCLVGPSDSGLNWSDFGKGVRYFEMDADMVDKLRPLDMLHTPPEIFNYIEALGVKKDQAVGSNSVIKGQPEGQLAGASGAAFALIQAQAISFNSGNQRAYFSTASSVMSKMIRILEKYADSEFISQVVGKSRSAGLKEFKFTGQDLSAVSSIVYEMVNPISQTIGGKLNFADKLLDKGIITTATQYVNMAQSGQPDVLTEDDEFDGLLILEENEWLTDGKPVYAIITQNHANHVQSHASKITLEMVQNDRDSVQRILDHVQEHIEIWTDASINNPGILMATGQQPLLPPPMQGMGAPPDDGGGQIGSSNSSESPGDYQDGPNLPNLPDIAGTNQEPVIPGVTQF